MIFHAEGGTKVKTIGESDLLAKDFMELGRRLGMKVQCAITYGEQPVGNAVGSSLESREALNVLMRRDTIPDLIDKATDIVSILLEMSGKKNGKELALEALKSGRAERKMREIIEAQGGAPEIKPEDIVIGDHTFEAYSNISGYLLWISNTSIVEIARLASSPKDKGSELIIGKKVGDRVEKGDLLFTIYAEKSTKLQRALDEIEKIEIVGVGDRMKMLIHEVKDIPVIKKAFVLDR